MYVTLENVQLTALGGEGRDLRPSKVSHDFECVQGLAEAADQGMAVFKAHLSTVR
jgi:hypothetical protein